MSTSILLGITLGLVIGGAFAWLQLQALRRNELIARQQQLPTLLKQLPSSGARVAFLLIALVLVQVFVPAANKWWLTGGLAAGYGVPFLWRLLQMAQRKN
jgi:hypothetical protein